MLGLTECKEKFKFVYLFPKLLALTTVSLLILRSLTVADNTWDVLAYHLPFAAIRSGMLSHNDFILPEYLLAYFNGFPSAIYYLKGFLWSITGRAESAQLVSILSIIIFVLFSTKILRIPTEWQVIGMLSIPTIQIGASGNYTDVPANMGMAMIFLSWYKLITKPTEIKKSDLIWLFIACLITSSSKLQAVVVGGILFSGYIATFFLLIAVGSIKYSELLTKKMIVTGFIFCAIAISYPALVNLYNYGNSIYPIQLNIAGIHLKGFYQVNMWVQPEYINSLPQQVRWLLSVLEFHAFDYRYLPYTQGQGDVPLTAKSLRMGGYFSPLILMSLFAFIFIAIKKVTHESIKGLLLLACVTVFVASLPGSHELRYYAFWAISVVTMAIHQLESNKNDVEVKTIFLSYKAFLIIGFLFVISITGGEYFKWQGASYAELNNIYPRDRFITYANSHNTYCYTGGDSKAAIFDSKVFSNPSNVVVIYLNEVCKGERGKMNIN